MVKKILLVSAQRTGTNALRSILALNNIADGKEYLGSNNPNGLHASLVRYIRSEDDYVPTAATLRAVFATAMDDLDAAYPFAEACVLACKYNAFGPFNPYGWRLTEEPAFLTFAKKAKLPIIHMMRRDLIGCYISAVRASKTGEWHSERDSDTDAKPFTVRLEKDAFLAAIRLRVAEREMFKGFLSTMPKVVDLYYEDALVDDELTPEAAGQIEAATSLRIAITGPSKYRKIPWHWQAAVENLDEVTGWIHEDPALRTLTLERR